MLNLENGVKDDAGGGGSEWVPRSATMKHSTGSNKTSYFIKETMLFIFNSHKTMCHPRGLHREGRSGFRTETFQMATNQNSPQTLHFFRGTGNLTRPESHH